MKIYSLAENTTDCGMSVEHGLSLYVVLNDGMNVLFDMGQGTLFAENAVKMGLNIADVDVAVLSHGHYDHGGGLETFMNLNTKAKIYIANSAFEPHYSEKEDGMKYIGLDQNVLLRSDADRLVFCNTNHRIADNLLLFSDVQSSICTPKGNRLLFGPSVMIHDDFCHEQNLLIFEEEKTVLLAGCAHSGIVNIIQQSPVTPTHVFAGMHLVHSDLSDSDETDFIKTLCSYLRAYTTTQFYTMHCTGVDAYKKMKQYLAGQLDYLSCGAMVNV